MTQEQQELISRRDITKKVTYIAPAVLAVIVASQRPAIAASTGGHEDPGNLHGNGAINPKKRD
jgi:hypothetical protein